MVENILEAGDGRRLTRTNGRSLVHPTDPDHVSGTGLPAHTSQCMGCGPANAAGLAMQVRRHGDVVVCDHVFDERQVGAPGLAHGGAVATACDDLFGFVLYLVAEPAVTRTLEVSYRRPVRIGVPHRIRAHLERRDGRKLHMRAEGTDPDGLVSFSAEAVFVMVELEHFTRHGPAGFDHVFGPVMAPAAEPGEQTCGPSTDREPDQG